ncbi:hypothetical protein HMPREF3291_18555 [Bacillus sp. HMSC76G11]|nr:hypothetical protein HMPREF3291_18555 [Bacillus sp. HMSC76G11]
MDKRALYLISAIFFIFSWFIFSHIYSEPDDWWSIHSLNQFITNSYHPIISWTKVSFLTIISLGFAYFAYKIFFIKRK